MRTLILLMVAASIMAAQEPKVTPPAETLEPAKLSSSELFALQTIAQKIADLTKALEEAKAFQQTLVRDDCGQRKILLASCRLNWADGTIAGLPEPKAPPIQAKAEPKK